MIALFLAASAGCALGLGLALALARAIAPGVPGRLTAPAALEHLARATETGADDVARCAVESATPGELADLCRARGTTLAAITPRLPTTPETR